LFAGFALRWGAALARRDERRRRACAAALAAVSGSAAPPFALPPAVAVAPTESLGVNETIEMSGAA
jgi:hypothetical protein